MGGTLSRGPDLGLEATGMPLRVLVIEANDRAARMLRETDAVSGLVVESVRDPRQAPQRLRNEFYDVIVIDLPPPQVSPQDLFREIVAAGREQAGRVIFLARDLGEPAIRRFLTRAGRPFLTEPVDPAELRDLVRRVGIGRAEA